MLGQLRLSVAKDEGLPKPDLFAFTWVTDFPMFEWDAEGKRFAAMHHPFTSPVPEDLDMLESDPGRVRAQAYDLVINGSEIGGLRKFVNVFVADDDVRYLQGLDTPVPDGETVSIIPAVAGG